MLSWGPICQRILFYNYKRFDNNISNCSRVESSRTHNEKNTIKVDNIHNYEYSLMHSLRIAGEIFHNKTNQVTREVDVNNDQYQISFYKFVYLPRFYETLRLVDLGAKLGNSLLERLHSAIN